ncbi:uncharacterized protein I206_106728 [Kwoniella pini CBS 10737]|uniref:Uncharacterized protein n=1 Tax=Kwoniella pini CBS 10737 TaxID=1296096 RepID=A0AAJ8L9Q6_9TREE
MLTILYGLLFTFLVTVHTTLGAAISTGGTRIDQFEKREVNAAPLWGSEGPIREDMNNYAKVDNDTGIKLSLAAMFKDGVSSRIKDNISPLDDKTVTFTLYSGSTMKGVTLNIDQVAAAYHRPQLEANWWWMGYEKAILDSFGDTNSTTVVQADPENILKLLNPSPRVVSKKWDLTEDEYFNYLKNNIVVLEPKETDTYTRKYRVVESVIGEDAGSASIETIQMGDQFWVHMFNDKASDLQKTYPYLIVVE